MERRRRGLGLKKSTVTPEKNAAISSRRMSTACESSKSTSEDKTTARGKASQKSQPTGSVTPKQKTMISRSNMTPLKPESPCSPLQSPGSQMIFLGTVASPEIEVSWDWSCSQVPNDMLPPKRTKRVQDRKILPVLPTINMCPRPRPPVQRQTTEEENQQRLEYYKNILSLRPSKSSSNVLYDSTNNNVEDVSLEVAKLNSTPKRPTTRLSSASNKKDEDNSLFDDSANEFMIECSQAIEEKLKNGEIDMGPIVDIKVSQAKRLHSPGIDCASLHKKTCHGRVNLFPENLKCDDITCSQDRNDNSDQTDSIQIQKPINSNNITNHSNFVLKQYEDAIENASLNDIIVSKPPRGKTESNQNSLKINKNKANVFNSDVNRNNSVHHPLNSNCHSLERRPLLSKADQSSSKKSSYNHTTSSQNRCIGRLTTNMSTTNGDTVEVFHKPQSCNNTLSKYNQSFLKTQTHSVNVIRNQQNVKRQENCTSSQEKEMQRPKFNCTIQDKSVSSDITSLLEDDFDLELSSLDVDSLCRNSENKEPESKCVTTSAPKMCTQQEIEAKRLAALEKLMMKKKR